MKKFVPFTQALILSVLLILPVSCISSQSFLPVKGIGTPVDKDFTVSDFQAVEVSGGFDVVLVQGNTEGLTLSAQENLFEYITVKVDQGILKIYTENNVMSTQSMKARISFKNIENLRVSGGGDITSETPVNVTNLGVTLSGGGDITSEINTNKLKLHISGGGDVKIDGKISDYFAEMSGGGDIQSVLASNLIDCRISGGGDINLKSTEQVADATIEISGGGNVNADINAAKLKCGISGGGDATLTGQATDLQISVNGGGDILAGNFSTTTASFSASGGSDIRVKASKELTGQISGGGDVYYSGSPEIVTIDAKGGSEIHKE